MPEYWEISYQSGQIPWDLGKSTPIFNQWIEACNKPLSICILGAGNGWDALNFAQKGHKVTAVDFSKSAVNNMKSSAIGSDLIINILHMNIFDLNKIYSNHFDVVLEYTCFCAIVPSRRRDYLSVVQNILKPKGEFVGLLFPIDKDPSEDGPPFGVDLDSTINLMSEFLSFIKKEIPKLSIKSRSGREVFVIFRKD